MHKGEKKSCHPTQTVTFYMDTEERIPRLIILSALRVLSGRCNDHFALIHFLVAHRDIYQILLFLLRLSPFEVCEY